MNNTTLYCTQKTAAILFILIGLLFTFAGCAQLYKFLGLTEQQTQEQISKDQKTIIRTITQVRTTTAEIITTAIAAIGTIATGFLTRWLGTERKLTSTLIRAIESADPASVKETVKAKATAAGLESLLHARVLKLT